MNDEQTPRLTYCVELTHRTIDDLANHHPGPRMPDFEALLTDIIERYAMHVAMTGVSPLMTPAEAEAYYAPRRRKAAASSKGQR